MTSRQVRIVHPDGSEAERDMFEQALTEHGIAPESVEVHYGGPTDADDWVERVGDAEIVLLGWSVPDDALRRFPNVRAIVYLGTGAADHVNLPLAEDLGIEVRAVLGYGDDSVAEHALALLFAAARGVPQHDAVVRRGAWDQAPGTVLRGKTVGVVGLGGIGRRFAEMATGIGMEVIGWNRSAEQGATSHESGIALAPLAEIFSRSDVVSLHLALKPETEGMITAELVDSLPSGAIVVNTARAGVLDTAAVLRRAEAGEVRFAADVFDPEPLPADSAERQTPGTVFTPHIAFFTPEATMALYRGAAVHLVELIGGDV